MPKDLGDPHPKFKDYQIQGVKPTSPLGGYESDYQIRFKDEKDAPYFTVGDTLPDSTHEITDIGKDERGAWYAEVTPPEGQTRYMLRDIGATRTPNVKPPETSFYDRPAPTQWQLSDRSKQILVDMIEEGLVDANMTDSGWRFKAADPTERPDIATLLNELQPEPVKLKRIEALRPKEFPTFDALTSKRILSD